MKEDKQQHNHADTKHDLVQLRNPRIYPMLEGTAPELFPEYMYGVGNDTAICISGGGVRSMTAGVGQLRALWNLGLLQQTNYLCSVSGGSWISALFTYGRGKTPPNTDEGLLGRPTAPSELTLARIKKDGNGLAQQAGTGNFGNTLLELLSKSSTENLWTNIVNQMYAKPFGIGDPKYQAHHGTPNSPRSVPFMNRAQYNRFTYSNPDLSSSLGNNFAPIYPESLKPFHVAMSTLMWNNNGFGKSDGLFNGGYFLPIQHTPLYSGIRTRCNMHGDWREHRKVGGNFIENWAFGSETDDGGQTLFLNPYQSRSMARIIAQSSAFFAGKIYDAPAATHLLAEILCMEEPFFQLGKGDKSSKFYVGDGGVLENTGVIPALQRGVKKIVMFVNSAKPYDRRIMQEEHGFSGISSQLPPLFGFKSTHWTSDTDTIHVFEKENFLSLIKDFSQQAPSLHPHNPLIYEGEFTTVENPYLSIRGGQRISVVLVYLNYAQAWVDLLSDEVRNFFLKNAHKSLRHFPNFPTIGDIPWEEIRKALHAGHPTEALHLLFGGLESYSNVIYNLLVEYNYWTVTSQADVFKRLLG